MLSRSDFLLQFLTTLMADQAETLINKNLNVKFCLILLTLRQTYKLLQIKSDQLNSGTNTGFLPQVSFFAIDTNIETSFSSFCCKMLASCKCTENYQEKHCSYLH